MEENKVPETVEVEEVAPAQEVVASPYKNGFLKALDNYFGVSKAGSNFKTEIMAGLTTFMTMVYILMVNAGMFGIDGNIGVSYGAIYIGTALSAVIGTVLIGVLAKIPMAQACGMGLNAFFVFTVCGWGLGNGMTYANALVFILLDGVVFILLTVTGLRKKIFKAIPDAVKVAIPAGIGLFIAFIGLQNAGIVVADSATKVKLVSLNFLASATYASVFPILVTFAGLIAITVLAKLKVKGSVLWGILGAAVLYYIFAGIGVAAGDKACKAIFSAISFDNPIQAFKDFGSQSIGKVFTEGFNFDFYLKGGDTLIPILDEVTGDFLGWVPSPAHSVGDLILTLLTGALAFCLVDMFDTIGTLYGACARGNLLDENGEVPNMDKAMLSDAIATCCGAILGVSTVTTFVESSSGVAEGGKTGVTSIVVAVLFFIAMFLSPIAQLIPTWATASALIYVGVLMMNCVKKIDWLDPAAAVPAFLTIAMMPFTYNISYGIGLGLISYVLIKLCTGKVKEINWLTAILGVIFAAMFFLTH